MNKQHLLAAAAIAALTVASCNNSYDGKGNHANKRQTEQTDTVAGFKPSGNVQKDAQQIAQQMMNLSRKTLNGNDDPQEAHRINQMIEVARQYYRQDGQEDAFQAAFTEVTEKFVNDLATEMGK